MIVTKSKKNKWQETERKKHIVDQAFSVYHGLYA